MSLWLLCLFLVFLLGLGGVAFITLLERKILSLSQLRLGPNKVVFFGVIQPLMDGIKLLFKSSSIPFYVQKLIFCLFPCGLLCLFLVFWGVIVCWGLVFFPMSCLLLLAFLGVGTYMVMLSGWSPISGFSKLGSLRSMLQGLSFEVSMVLVVLCLSLSFYSLSLFKLGFFLELSFIWLLLWIFMMLLDLNRAPFDLLEGESELISGFNLEMGSLLFVYIFLSEYGMILVSSLLGSWGVSGSYLTLTLTLMVVFLFIRSCFPRLRYDVISGLLWHSILSLGLVLWIINMFLI